jgi:hypothetical protein
VTAPPDPRAIVLRGRVLAMRADVHPFDHWCAFPDCEEWGPYGYGPPLIRKWCWFCREHRPELDGFKERLAEARAKKRARLLAAGTTTPASSPAHTCHAIGCSTPVPPEMLMCAPHWRQVPAEIKAAIWRTYRPGQCDDKRPSREWLDAANAAIAAVAPPPPSPQMGLL